MYRSNKDPKKQQPKKSKSSSTTKSKKLSTDIDNDPPKEIKSHRPRRIPPEYVYPYEDVVLPQITSDPETGLPVNNSTIINCTHAKLLAVLNDHKPVAMVPSVYLTHSAEIPEVPTSCANRKIANYRRWYTGLESTCRKNDMVYVPIFITKHQHNHNAFVSALVFKRSREKEACLVYRLLMDHYTNAFKDIRFPLLEEHCVLGVLYGYKPEDIRAWYMYNSLLYLGLPDTGLPTDEPDDWWNHMNDPERTKFCRIAQDLVSIHRHRFGAAFRRAKSNLDKYLENWTNDPGAKKELAEFRRQFIPIGSEISL